MGSRSDFRRRLAKLDPGNEVVLVVVGRQLDTSRPNTRTEGSEG